MFFRKKKIGDLPHKQHDLAKLKQITSILVIDNDPNAFPDISTLRSEGYNITFWEKLETLSQLEAGTYDIIILDIGGVATKWGPGDGLEVLRLLKDNNPGQYVIAFSGQKSVHQLEEFWKLSDAQMKKPVTIADCKRKLDEALHERANADHYWNSIRSRLSACGVPEKEIARLEHQIVRQVLSKDTSSDRIRGVLGGVLQNEKVQDLVTNLAVKFISAAVL
jgi:CheY-like chemotaxis protein